MAEPVLLMASTAYSSCCNLPSGEKVVVFESYLLDMGFLKYIQKVLIL